MQCVPQALLLVIATGFGADDEDCMQCTIHSVLAVATQAGVTSLALPLLGCGLAKWPTELAARAHVQAVFAAAATNLIGTALKVGAPEL